MKPSQIINRQAALARSRERAARNRREYRSAFGQFGQQYLAARSTTLHGAKGKLLPVNESTALQLAAVFCSVRILAGVRATLPLQLFERKGTGVRDQAVHSHPVAELLRRPTPYLTTAPWQQLRESHLALWGNSYTELTFDTRTGETVAAQVHHPCQVQPWLDATDRDRRGWPRKKYRVWSADGGSRDLDDSQMVHTMGLPAGDGLQGVSTLAANAGTLSGALASDQLAATFYTNGAKPFLVVTTPDYLDDEPYARLSREITQEYTGDNSFGSMLLEGGAQAHFATLPLKDVQLLETRQWQGQQIASQVFGLPPHLAGYLDNAHYDNLDEQDRALVVFTLAPKLVADEQGLQKLLRPRERDRFYLRHNVDALLRGQQKERYEAHRSSLMAGWRTVNEVRAKEDLPPLPGGDVLPRPAAIWGKPTGQADGQETGQATETRAQLRALVADTVRAQQHAERVQAERLAGRPDFEQRLADFYGKHVERMAERLRAVCSDPAPIRAHLVQHQRELVAAGRSADPRAAVAACLAGWADHPDQLADQLARHEGAA